MAAPVSWASCDLSKSCMRREKSPPLFLFWLAGVTHRHFMPLFTETQGGS